MIFEDFVKLQDNVKLFYKVFEAEAGINAPTIIFLHGGPGLADHNLYVPFWSQLKDVARVIFFDMRGHGQSEGWDQPDTWNLKQWGTDVYEFCNALDIEKPIVVGFSFGGWVALDYATRYPDHPGALILCNTEAKNDAEVRAEAYKQKAIARGQDGDLVAEIVKNLAVNAGDSETSELYLKHCAPLFSEKPFRLEELDVCKQNEAVWLKFDKEEQYQFDYHEQLNMIVAPTLVISGSEDPEHPVICAKKMVSEMTSANVRFEIIVGAGDPVYADKPEETLRILRDFILSY